MFKPKRIHKEALNRDLFLINMKNLFKSYHENKAYAKEKKLDLVSGGHYNTIIMNHHLSIKKNMKNMSLS